MLLDLTPDDVLATTRTVRKRLDPTRPVEREVLEDCLLLAQQAPSSSFSQNWHFVVVTDAAKRKGLGDLYKRAFEVYRQMQEQMAPPLPENDKRTKQLPRVVDSAQYLADHLHEVPVHVIPCIEGRFENGGTLAQASMYGSILPAAWSLMLALRARGLGSAWTTLHIMFEQEAAQLLGIPADITQTALIPIAHYTGKTFKPADRLPARELTSWETWGRRRA